MKDKWKQRYEQLKNFKPADKPRKAEKVNQAPGMGARKAGMVVFWVMASFMFLVVLVNILNNDAKSQVVAPEEKPENPATTPAAIDFAKGFAQTYFTWTPTAEGWEKRAAALSPLLAEGLDEQAGLLTGEQEWRSSAGNARVLQVEEVSATQALVTVEIQQSLSRTKDGDEENTSVWHTFTVPVGYDTAYGVYDLPSFTAVPIETGLSSDVIDGEALEAEQEANIKNFLPTFFQSYVTDTPDKLAYVLEGETVKGLEGTKEFVEIRDAVVVKGQDDTTFEITASVVLKDPKTGTSYLSNYRMTVAQQGDRYVVTHLNEGAEKQ